MPLLRRQNDHRRELRAHRHTPSAAIIRRRGQERDAMTYGGSLIASRLTSRFAVLRAAAPPASLMSELHRAGR
jgi:hypothetical protein